MTFFRWPRFGPRHEDRLRSVLTAVTSQAVPLSLGELWLHDAVARIAGQLEDGAELINLTVVAKCPDGFTVACGIEPGDAAPERSIMSQVTVEHDGEQVAALSFTSAGAPDSPEGLEP